MCGDALDQAHRHTRIPSIYPELPAMKLSTTQKLLALSILGASAAAFSTTSFAAVDADAAQALAKKNDCMKCHAIDKDKKASSYKSIAAKWKGKPDAEAKLVDALTKTPKVKMKDRTEEEHKAIGTKDMGEIKNLVAWILSQ
jgi:cytochrome c